jgi:hypothetical protein
VSGRSVVLASPNNNVATIIKIINTSSTACNYLVRFTNGSTRRCDAPISALGSFQSAFICSRPVPDGSKADLSPCFSASCNITLDDLKAVIYSTDTAACSQMLVDASVVWTDTGDNNILAVRPAAIVKIDPADRAWTTKGD